jgi:putative toxin-antitoxin system antitoxin component (TIGR02293 family)
MPTTAFQVAKMPTTQAVLAIRTGLPAAAFAGVAKALSLTVEELAVILGISPRTVRDQRRKLGRLSSENTEKLVRIARIQHQARRIFSTDEAVSQWLALPAPALDGLKPIDLLDTDLGAREIESVLNGIAYGNVM